MRLPFLLISIRRCWILLSCPVMILRSSSNSSESEMSTGALERLMLSWTSFTSCRFFSINLLKASSVSYSRTFSSSFRSSSSACSYSVFSLSRWTAWVRDYFGAASRRPPPRPQYVHWALFIRWIGRGKARLHYPPWCLEKVRTAGVLAMGLEGVIHESSLPCVTMRPSNMTIYYKLITTQNTMQFNTFNFYDHSETDIWIR